MSKNLIRKGLAIGATVSLTLAGVVALSAPASAVGRDTGLVRLAPETGTSYKTLLGSSLNLKANFNQTLEQSGTSMKFLVEGDDDSVTKFDIDVNGSTADVYSARTANNAQWETTGNTISVTFTAHGLINGDVLNIDSDNDGIDGAYTVTTSSNANSFVATRNSDSATADDGDVDSVVFTVTSSNGINTRSYIQARTFGNRSVLGAGNAVSDDRATDGSYVITATDDNASETILRLVSSSDATHSVTVTAWFDEDLDGVIDSTEEIATPQVVTFVKPSEATVTTTLGALSLNDVNLSATVLLADLNMQQLASDISVRFSRNGYSKVFDSLTAVAGVPDGSDFSDSSVSFVTLDGNLQTGNWDIPDYATAWDANGGEAAGLDADKVDAALWGAQALYGGAALGAIDQKSPVSTVVNGYSLALDSNTNANGAKSEDADITAGGAAPAVSTGKVRAGTKSFKVTMTLTSNTTTKVAAANIPVSVVVAPTNIATADAVKVNGTAVTTTNKTITGTTNAAGQFVLTVETATGNNADQLVFTPTVQNIAQGALTVAWADAVYGIYNTDGETNTSNDKNYSIVVGGSLNVTYDVIDQWGVGAPSGYAIQLTRSGSSRTTETTNFPYRANVSNGKATLSVVDNGTGAGSDTVTATLWSVATGGGLGTSGDTQAFTLTYAASAAAIAATALTAEVNNNGVAVGATDVYPVAIEYKDFINADTRYSLTEVPSYAAANAFNNKSDLTADAQLTLSGKVTNAAGSNVAGKVTISSPGLMFKATVGSSKYLYATNSITVYTADGNYSVEVFGQATGKRTITVTGAGAAKTVDVTFANAASTAGTKVSFVAPKSIKGGRTLTVSARLTDKFGNPVELTSAQATTQKMAISYDGPGFVISEPVSLNANGTATVRVLLSVGDTGPAIVSFTYTNGDSVVVSGSSATWVGPIANAKAGAKKGRVIVEAYRAKGKTVNVFVGSTRVASFVADKANDSMVVRGIKSGTRNVRVVLSGPGEDFRGAITVK